MKRITGTLLLLFLSIIVLNAQFFDDFSDGDFLSEPQWFGDIQNFVVNDKYQLQLDAAEAGNSKLYVKYNTIDSMTWNLYLNMDFNPSNSNKLKIYLMVDSPDLDNTSGYFIKIGENGNDDNLKFYSIGNGNETLLGEGELGLFSKAFAAYLKITRQSSGIWTISIKKENNFYKEDFQVFDDKFHFDSAYFMLDMDYSKTRVDKFVFDDIDIRSFEYDNKAPVLNEAKLLDKNRLILSFDEELDKTSALQKENYTIRENGLVPVDILYDNSIANIVELRFANPFESGKNYTITVKGVKDMKGNEILEKQSARFYLIESPEAGDIVINEILFNPRKGASDFIELINISKKYLNLKGVKILNVSKDDKAVKIEDEIVLSTAGYVCISADTNSVINDYFVPDSALLYQNKLPGFDDDEGNVSLIYFDSVTKIDIVIDSFDYSEDMHSSFITDAEGVSLERKNPLLSTNDRFNWTSASTITDGATPGYKNSAFFDPGSDTTKAIILEKKVFSPNDDGVDDELIIKYSFENPGNYADFYIFDSRGRLISQIANNELLGTRGIIVWDGYVDSAKVPVGVYLLYYKIVNENSNVIVGKKTFVLADYLK